MQVVCCRHDANLIVHQAQSAANSFAFMCRPLPYAVMVYARRQRYKDNKFPAFCKTNCMKDVFWPIAKPLISVQLNIDRQTVTLQTVTF